jgi:hypothetical protein
VIKKLSILILIIAAGIGIWVVFALWSGIYSVYSFPPSKEHPDGATLLVSRDEWEPMFNSPQYRAPVREAGKTQGVTLGSAPKLRRPLERRTIVTLPYVEWAYKKSLEPQETYVPKLK